jgi:hypothetical protein
VAYGAPALVDPGAQGLRVHLALGVAGEDVDHLEALGQVQLGGALVAQVLLEVLEGGGLPVDRDDDRGRGLGLLRGVEGHEDDLVDVRVAREEVLHLRTRDDHAARALDLVGVAVDEGELAGGVAIGDVAGGVPAVVVGRRPHEVAVAGVEQADGHLRSVHDHLAEPLLAAGDRAELALEAGDGVPMVCQEVPGTSCPRETPPPGTSVMPQWTRRTAGSRSALRRTPRASGAPPRAIIRRLGGATPAPSGSSASSSES